MLVLAVAVGWVWVRAVPCRLVLAMALAAVHPALPTSFFLYIEKDLNRFVNAGTLLLSPHPLESVDS